MTMRATRPTLGCLLVGFFALTASCGDAPPEVEQRKALLRPDEVRQRRADELEQRRIFDPQNELIPSGERVAGLELPRGLKLYRELDREHFLEAPRITREQLERYFAPRLVPSGITRTATSVTFESAQIKDSPTSPLLTVRIAQVAATDPASELMLREAPPPRVFPSEAQAQKQLAERLKYAD
jgi:hypothetical protein